MRSPASLTMTATVTVTVTVLVIVSMVVRGGSATTTTTTMKEEKDHHDHDHHVAVFPLARWCQSQLPWSAEARRDCFKMNSTWLEDEEMIAAKDLVRDYLYHHSHLFPPHHSATTTTTTGSRHLLGRGSGGRGSGSSGSPPIYIVLHVAILEDDLHGLVILDQLLHAIYWQGSRLLSKITAIYLLLYGHTQRVHEILERYPIKTTQQLHIILAFHQLIYFNEFPSLALLYHLVERYTTTTTSSSSSSSGNSSGSSGNVKGDDAYILYLHSKGVTHPHDLTRSYMRDLMIYYTLYHYQQNLEILERGYNTSGLLLYPSPYLHYSGNILWMRSSHVMRNINPLDDLVWRWRFAAEAWPLSGAAAAAAGGGVAGGGGGGWRECPGGYFSPSFTVHDFNRYIAHYAGMEEVKELIVDLSLLPPPRCAAEYSMAQ
eukprot:scaffold7211_cov247-Ochromonas_danica.AAC.3